MTHIDFALIKNNTLWKEGYTLVLMPVLVHSGKDLTGGLATIYYLFADIWSFVLYCIKWIYWTPYWINHHLLHIKIEECLTIIFISSINSTFIETRSRNLSSSDRLSLKRINEGRNWIIVELEFNLSLYIIDKITLCG